VSYATNLQKTAKIMIATTLLFLVIQIPATMDEDDTAKLDAATATKDQARAERQWALIGMIAACVAFAAYLIYCFRDANEDKVLERVIEGIQKKEISIGAALKFAKETTHPEEEGTLPKADQTRFRKIVRPFFAIYDANGNGILEPSEFKNLLIVLGERYTPKADQMIEDASGSSQLSFDRVVAFLGDYLREENLNKVQDMAYNPRYMPRYEDDEEEEEMPEDLLHLTRGQQLLRVGLRATWMMGLGTLMVLIFSDPMVDVLSDWGRRLDVSPFYIAFILAPMASNASELVSAYTYAQKKSQKSMTTALSTLVGAACMNNTFCFAIFLALVYWKKLAWQFSAETLSMVVIQWIIGFITIKKTTHTVPLAFLILVCYPGCLFIVWFFENIVGWD
jgi:Ca2+/Na+ antiporter